MKRTSDIKEFLIFVEGPEEEMHKLEETIREKKCVWDLCVKEPWLFGVYSTEVKKCGHARLEFCGDGTKHFDVYIKHFSDHMRQNPTHMISCKFKAGFRLAGVWDREKYVRYSYGTFPVVTIKPSKPV